MNLFKLSYLTFFILPLQLLSMETDVEYAQLIKNIEALPNDIKVEIFKYKCAQLCPQLIEQAQTLPELKWLFKSFIVLGRDFRQSKFFQSTLFKLLEMKKHKILCALRDQLEGTQAISHTTFDIVNKGIKSKDITGETILHVISKRRDLTDLIKLLIANGADINALDNDGCTPLHMAAGKCRLESTQVLVENGANTNIQDVNGRTPLYNAIHHADLEMTDLFIKNGALLNIQDTWQKTPLNFAVSCMGPDDQIVDLLLNNGADITIADGDGKTALDIAQERGFQAIVELLKAAQNKNK